MRSEGGPKATITPRSPLRDERGVGLFGTEASRPTRRELGDLPRVCLAAPAHDVRMEIFIDVTRSSEGRMVGTAHRPSDGSHMPFSGTMELLACIEEMCTTAPPVERARPARSGGVESCSDEA